MHDTSSSLFEAMPAPADHHLLATAWGAPYPNTRVTDRVLCLAYNCVLLTSIYTIIHILTTCCTDKLTHDLYLPTGTETNGNPQCVYWLGCHTATRRLYSAGNSQSGQPSGVRVHCAVQLRVLRLSGAAQSIYRTVSLAGSARAALGWPVWPGPDAYNYSRMMWTQSTTDSMIVRHTHTCQVAGANTYLTPQVVMLLSSV